MGKLMMPFLGMLVTVLLFSTVVSAHVVVYPQETTQGSYEVFTVRVPTEKEAATIKVRVSIPEGVTVSRFEPKSDWTYETVTDDTGKITSVTWTTVGEGLSATEFGEFKMQGKVADQAEELIWRAYQTYADDEVVEWIGAADSDRPAPITHLNAGTGGDGHGLDQDADGSESETDGGLNLPLYISIAALVIALIALLLIVRKKRV